MARQLNVLYGFSSDKIQQSITKEMVLRGCSVKSVKMTTKDLIKDYLKNHPETDVVILKEYLDGGGVYSPIELTELVDDVRNVNVVIVLATSHRGKNEMREIYSAGILNAFFSDGKFGANPDKIAELACKGRTRREARNYYKINETVPDHVNLTFEEFNDNYRYLINDQRGMNIINRFVQISHMLYPGQMGAFIDRLPDKVKAILMKYSEFYDIAHKIYKLGYSKMDYKKPKGIKEGITKEAIETELSRASKKKEVEKPQIVAAKSSSKAPKQEIVYEEKIGLERVEEEDVAPSVAEETPPPAKKRGLFGSKPKAKDKKKASRKDADREESIFDQESDVDFELEGIDAEPIGDDDGWDSEVQYAEPPVRKESEMVREQRPSPVERQIEPPDYTEKPVEVGEPVVQSEPTPAADTDVSQPQVAESSADTASDLDGLSLDELKAMLNG